MRGPTLCSATHVAPLYAVPLLSIILQARAPHRTMWGHLGGTTDSKAAQIPRPRPVPHPFPCRHIYCVYTLVKTCGVRSLEFVDRSEHHPLFRRRICIIKSKTKGRKVKQLEIFSEVFPTTSHNFMCVKRLILTKEIQFIE